MTENTPKIDPTLAMLALAQQKSRAIRDCPDDQEDQCEKAIADEWLALDAIVASKPTTMAGVAAVLRFFAARMDRDSFCQTELLETLMGNMATALDPIELGRPS
jgi:hypothetical protein